MNRCAAIAVSAAALLTLAGCASAQMGDRGGQEGAPPDKVGDVDYVEVYRNADGIPNISRTCVLGLGFATPLSGWGSSSEGASGGATPLIRVAEWDAFCATKTKAGAR